MNVIFYMIFAWIFGELFHLTIFEWLKTRYKIDNSKLKTIFFFIGIALIIVLVSSGFYRVTTRESIVVTSLIGKTTVNEDIGIKYSLLSSREKINTQKQTIKFPPLANEGYTTITSDEKPVIIHCFLEYQITNVDTWGIKNKHSENQLKIVLASIVKKVIQQSEYSLAKNNLDTIEKRIEEELIPSKERYGIEIIHVYMQVSDTLPVNIAKSEAEAKKIKSEAEKNANNLLKESIDIFNPAQLEYLKTRMLVEDGDIRWVIPESGQVMVDGS